MTANPTDTTTPTGQVSATQSPVQTRKVIREAIIRFLEESTSPTTEGAGFKPDEAFNKKLADAYSNHPEIQTMVQVVHEASAALNKGKGTAKPDHTFEQEAGTALAKAIATNLRGDFGTAMAIAGVGFLHDTLSKTSAVYKDPKGTLTAYVRSFMAACNRNGVNIPDLTLSLAALKSAASAIA